MEWDSMEEEQAEPWDSGCTCKEGGTGEDVGQEDSPARSWKQHFETK